MIKAQFSKHLYSITLHIHYGGITNDANNANKADKRTSRRDKKACK